MDNLLDYDGLIYSVINRYSKRFDRDDLYQVGMLGLIEAYKNKVFHVCILLYCRRS